jgi:hypothetical protein
MTKQEIKAKEIALNFVSDALDNNKPYELTDVFLKEITRLNLELIKATEALAQQNSQQVS